ncbi:MAG: amidohydrolase family protein [Planctomycetia bacterium]|nr:MAG: amidohydrolase family protein [Planctomycetia bacterium]
MILRAAWVFSIDAPALQDGAVCVHDGRIEWVRPWSAVSADERSAAVDLGRAALLPGLVNPHAHLELSCYAGQLPPGPLWTWLSGLLRLREAPDRAEREARGVRDGAAQALMHGTTCIGDISRTGSAWRSLADSPIRAVCFAELLSLATEPPRNPAELIAVLREVPQSDRRIAGVSAHAPYTVDAAGIAASISLAVQMERPWCAHWAETREEVAFLSGMSDALPPPIAAMAAAAGIGGHAGSPIGALEKLLERAFGADADGRRRARTFSGALAHCNYLDREDIARLARLSMTVVYCPRAHEYYGHESHPLPLLLEAGVRVALGTDSLAATPSMSLLEEARHVWKRVARGRVSPLLNPERLLRMITLDAARALRLDDRIGSLRAGKQADLSAFPIRSDCAANDALEAARALVETAPLATGVWVDGVRVT